MSKSLLSASWYRAAELKPRLAEHVELHRQRFRGKIWYVVQDHASGRFHRVTPPGFLIMGLLNGRRTIQSIWEMVCDKLGEDLPTQDEVIQLLAQLHQADLLRSDTRPDFEELAHRGRKLRRKELLMKVRNPMALRMPLFDPDRFLAATLPWVRPIFSRTGFVLWLALVIYGIVEVALNWGPLTENIFDRAFTTNSIIIMIAVYPVIKALHELGHGYATKAWGGEVHEMGMMLLVMLPVPYVDASSSSAFVEKWRRAVVGAAGIMVELAIAAGAIILWVNLEPGLARAVAFNAALIGSVSTLFFNGNPLLRFDGYFVLSDIVEIPNLGPRSNKYFFYLVKKYLLGVEDPTSPAGSGGERAWMLFYAVASFCYRMVVIVTISLFIATKLFFVGILLAIWALSQMIVIPIGKGVGYLARSPDLRRKRGRAYAVAGGFVAALLVLAFGVPLPHATVIEGVVSAPDRSFVRVGATGFVRRVVATPNSAVRPGDVLIELEDPILKAQRRAVAAELAVIQLRLEAAKVVDRVQTDMLKQQVKHIEARLARLRQMEGQLLVRIRLAGRFVIARAGDLPGRFVRQGDLIGYVVSPSTVFVKGVASQDDFDLIRQRTKKVELRVAGRLHQKRAARLRKLVPGATTKVPSRTLTTAGGGAIAIDPRDPEGVHSLEKLFVFEIGFERPLENPALGARVHIRFDHGAEPIAWRVLRSLRQLFLKQFRI